MKRERPREYYGVRLGLGTEKDWNQSPVLVISVAGFEVGFHWGGSELLVELARAWIWCSCAVGLERGTVHGLDFVGSHPLGVMVVVVRLLCLRNSWNARFGVSH
ncbi:hypothetical protein Droror1_Dr00020744 [Drosera rotundifolia]